MIDIFSFMLGKKMAPPPTEVEELDVTENGTYTAEEGKAFSPVEVSVPQTTLESLSITENGTYTADEGKAYESVTVFITGPFLTFPKSDSTPTSAEVLEKGLRLYSSDTCVFLSNSEDVFCFRVGTTLVFASESNKALVYSLFGNGNLRTSTIPSADAGSGLYYNTMSNVTVSDIVYNCSSISDGLSRLAMFI